MAKKKGRGSKPSKKATKPTTRRATAQPDNKQIEQIDREILRLVNQRAKLAGQHDYSPDDCRKAVAEIVKKNKGPLGDESILAIFREIQSASQSLRQPHRVAYLGPKYSYSYLAAIEQFGESADLVPVPTIAAVFEELNRRHVEFGVVPLENSTDGRIVDTLGMFARLPVKICGEIPLAIHHQLLAKCRRDEVTEVYSKPQAISQCREWLAKHLPSAKIEEMASTTSAAELSAERQGAAAIASRRAGMHYGLEVIAENIEDNRNNVTRFAVIGDHAGKRTGNDKTAVMLELHHRPGALADVMTIFKANKLNLTWIESFPMPGPKPEYLFFVEMEGHQNDAKVGKAMDSLARKTARLEMLGSYPVVEPR